jgi:type IV pilus assembly protein PilV
MQLKSRTKSAHQAGFNMVEVLVTLAILSVGLLGVAALQSIGIRFNQQSYQRTQAVFQAYDILDRMRANWKCVDASPACAYDNVVIGTIPGSPPICLGATATPCTPAQMATSDVAQWNTANAQMISAGRGAICRGSLDASNVCTVAPAGSRTYSVAVVWIENDLNMRIEVQAEL